MQRMSIRPRLVALAVLVALSAQPIVYAVDGARQYTVKPGDTLGGISNQLGVSQQRLLELNQLPDANIILAGQTLALPEDAGAAASASAPAGGPATSQPEPRDYTVRTGDSVSSIALSFGVPVEALLAANHIAEPDRIGAGQKLLIPAGAPGRFPVPAGPLVAPAGERGGGVGALLEAAASNYHVDPALAKALAWYLSSWRVDATSPSGAVGPMQITASTQEWVSQSLLKRSADRADPRDNVEIGVAYLGYLSHRLGDERQAVAAYLQGPASLSRSGPSPSTTRAVEAIYASRGRFADSPTGPQPAANQPAANQAAPSKRDLLADVTAAAKLIAPAARVGVAGRNLATGDRLDWRAGEVFASASVNKLPIMVEVLRQVGAGKLTRTAAVGGDLGRMIVQSDNAAANRLLDAVGEDNVNRTMGSLGLGSTLMRNHFSGVPDEPGFNQTSPGDAAALLSLLADDKLVSAAASREMRAMLARTQDGSKLARGLPPGTRLSHKSGWYPGVANDIGIVTTARGSYVLAVFSQGIPDDETGNRLLAEISRLAYQAWGR